MKNFVALLAGIVFGIGLAVSQMIDPVKVLNFLDITGNWDPSLAFVMGGAVGVTFIGYSLSLRRASPLLQPRFYLPTAHKVDRRLLAGAALFGVGWGLAGYCPGPAIGATALGTWEPFAFTLSMMLGTIVFQSFNRGTSEPLLSDIA